MGGIRVVEDLSCVGSAVSAYKDGGQIRSMSERAIKLAIVRIQPLEKRAQSPESGGTRELY